MNGEKMAKTPPVVKKSSQKKRIRTKELLIMGPEIKVNGKTVAGGIQTASVVVRLPDIPALMDYCREMHSVILARVFETPIGEAKNPQGFSNLPRTGDV